MFIHKNGTFLTLTFFLPFYMESPLYNSIIDMSIKKIGFPQIFTLKTSIVPIKPRYLPHQGQWTTVIPVVVVLGGVVYIGVGCALPPHPCLPTAPRTKDTMP